MSMESDISLAGQITKLQDKITDLEQAMIMYADHHGDCLYWWPRKECDCGFTKVIDGLSAETD